MSKKKAVKARQRAEGMARRNLLALTHRDFAKLLKDWGWVDAGVGTSGAANAGHQKYRWHGHQVNFSRPHGSIESMVPRVVAERAAAIMGVSITELLTGPTIDNAGVVKAMTRAEQLDSGEINRWADARDRLGVDIGDATNAAADDDVDLTWDLHDDDADCDSGNHPEQREQVNEVASTYPLDCPVQWCHTPLVNGTCRVHGRPLVLPLPNEPVISYHIDAFLDAKFMDLLPAERRVYLALQRRLRTEGLLTEDDLRPLTPRDLPHTPNRSVVASTPRATPPGKAAMTTTETQPRRTMPPVDEATKADRIARMNATRDKGQADRKANAKPVGTADTIEQVLERTSGPIFQQRRDLLNALVAVGGHIASESGQASQLLITAIEKNTGRAYNGTTGLSHLLRAMEADGQIARKMNAKRTYLITVVDPLRDEFKTEPEQEPVVEAPVAEAPVAEAPVVAPPEPEHVIDPGGEEAAPVVDLTTPAPAPESPPTHASITQPAAATIAKNEPALASSNNGNGSGPITLSRSATLSTAMSDDDLWDLLDVLLDSRTLPFSRESVSLFNEWCSATRAIIEKSIAR